MLELTLRLVFSLAVVLGLLLLLARLGARRFKGGAGSLVQVVHRQPLSRGASVAVVTVGSRVLVLGATEHQVSVLAELDPEELVTEEQLAGDGTGDGTSTPPLAGPSAAATLLERPERPTVPTIAPETTPLSGSVLSAATWRQAIAALRAGDRGRHRE